MLLANWIMDSILVRMVGVEPTTFGLKIRYSASWITRAKFWHTFYFYSQSLQLWCSSQCRNVYKNYNFLVDKKGIKPSTVCLQSTLAFLVHARPLKSFWCPRRDSNSHYLNFEFSDSAVGLLGHKILLSIPSNFYFSTFLTYVRAQFTRVARVKNFSAQ